MLQMGFTKQFVVASAEEEVLRIIGSKPLPIATDGWGRLSWPKLKLALAEIPSGVIDGVRSWWTRRRTAEAI